MHRDFTRLQSFLEERAKDVGPANDYETNTNVGLAAIDELHKRYNLANKQVADIGCGTGSFSKALEAKGAKVTGITIRPDNLPPETKNLKFVVADQSFLPAKFLEKFDILFARHILEHSIFPFFTLHEYNRVLKLGGIAYVEVPAAEQPSWQEVNNDHYSVLGEKMWLELFHTSGFGVEIIPPMRFTHKEGPHKTDVQFDEWKRYILTKIGPPFKGWFAAGPNLKRPEDGMEYTKEGINFYA